MLRAAGFNSCHAVEFGVATEAKSKYPVVFGHHPARLHTVGPDAQLSQLWPTIPTHSRLFIGTSQNVSTKGGRSPRRQQNQLATKSTPTRSGCTGQSRTCGTSSLVSALARAAQPCMPCHSQQHVKTVSRTCCTDEKTKEGEHENSKPSCHSSRPFHDHNLLP